MKRDQVVVNEGYGRVRLTEPCEPTELQPDGTAILLDPVRDKQTGEISAWAVPQTAAGETIRNYPERWYGRVIAGPSAGQLVAVAAHVCEPE